MVPMQLPWMAAKIVLRPVAELRAHPGNARVHGAAQIEQIKASMLAFGFTNPLLVDEQGVLIAGHGRLEAAVALGIERVPVIVLKHLSVAQKEALRLAGDRGSSAGRAEVGQGSQSHRRERDLGPGAAARRARDRAGGGDRCCRAGVLGRRAERNPGGCGCRRGGCGT
jgi:hypothetical protein